MSEDFFLTFVWNFLTSESNQKIPRTHQFINIPFFRIFHLKFSEAGSKTWLMNLRTIINKTLILSVFVLAGYLLARSFYYGSFIGIILALVGIGAWATFLYQVNKMQAKRDEDVTEELPGSINY